MGEKPLPACVANDEIRSRLVINRGRVGGAEIDTAITALGREPGGGFVALSGAFLRAHRALIILAAARNNVPAVYNSSVYARDGGLLSYGPDGVDTFRRAASYVDRILRGAKPAELPVQTP
jgi:putative ABC transport system substrate-binding protein